MESTGGRLACLGVTAASFTERCAGVTCGAAVGEPADGSFLDIGVIGWMRRQLHQRDIAQRATSGRPVGRRCERPKHQGRQRSAPHRDDRRPRVHDRRR
jgi:hypothetical protein